MSDAHTAGDTDVAGDDLDAIEDRRSRRVSFQGQELTVKPLTIGQMPRLIRAARPVIDEIAQLSQGDESIELSIDTFLDWIERYGEQLVDAVAAATDRDRSFIAGGAPDEFLELLVAVVSVNMDFFGRRLLPLGLRIRAAVRDLNVVPAGSGRTQSRSSSRPATA